MIARHSDDWYGVHVELRVDPGDGSPMRDWPVVDSARSGVPNATILAPRETLRPHTRYGVWATGYESWFTTGTRRDDDAPSGGGLIRAWEDAAPTWYGDEGAVIRFDAEPASDDQPHVFVELNTGHLGETVAPSLVERSGCLGSDSFFSGPWRSTGFTSRAVDLAGNTGPWSPPIRLEADDTGDGTGEGCGCVADGDPTSAVWLLSLVGWRRRAQRRGSGPERLTAGGDPAPGRP